MKYIKKVPLLIYFTCQQNVYLYYHYYFYSITGRKAKTKSNTVYFYQDASSEPASQPAIEQRLWLFQTSDFQLQCRRLLLRSRLRQQRPSLLRLCLDGKKTALPPSFWARAHMFELSRRRRLLHKLWCSQYSTEWDGVDTTNFERRRPANVRALWWTDGQAKARTQKRFSDGVIGVIQLQSLLLPDLRGINTHYTGETDRLADWGGWGE